MNSFPSSPAHAATGGKLDVAVVGAGVAGLVTALLAVREGMRVGLFEREEDFSGSAAWRAGGMLAPFCEAEGSEEDVVRLGLRSMQLWPTLYKGVRREGTLVVAPPRDLAGLTRFGRLTEGHDSVDASEIALLEPDLAGRFRTGLFYGGEGHLNPREVMPALLAELVSHGATATFGWTGEIKGLAADRVVDCRGLGARDRFPDLRGVKGEMAVIRAPDLALNRPVRLLHHRHPLYVVPRGDGVHMIGATTVETDVGDGVTVRSAGELLTQAYNLHPAFGDAEIVEFNSGLRPAFPGNEPRIVDGGRVIAVNGLYRHGWLIAPAMAEIAVGRLTDRIKEHEVLTCVSS
ncbi:Glycine oxidase [Hartmannibacter diazotrophicus]|uniref:D-amino-acid oxidase n=1 Tax=Hartmannibacter diazotrophicus TaxID=1482074 RepID=A0A2C9D7H7_9HYPH|nr:glycine oxidase ThiO [Hartmannibacter diazotrophicus]SON56272.1 Glycine oxidase [Hartmannibacter diazotrophicus]